MTCIPEGCTEDDIYSLVSGAGVPLRSVSIELIGQDAPSAFLRLEPEDQFTRAAPPSKEELVTTTSDPVADAKDSAAASNEAKEDKIAADEEDPKEVNGEGKNKEEAGSDKKEAAATDGGSSEGNESKQDAKLAPTPPRPKAGEVFFKREEFFSDPDKARNPPPHIPGVYYLSLIPYSQFLSSPRLSYRLALASCYFSGSDRHRPQA